MLVAPLGSLFRGEPSADELRFGPAKLGVRILGRAEVGAIDPSDWQRLADVSVVPNPFFERWSLIPALRHLDRKKQVFVVTVYAEDCLVCLFPVCLVKALGFFPYLCIWQSRECLNSDILHEEGVPLGDVLRQVMKQFKASFMMSPSHGMRGFQLPPEGTFCQVRRLRKAVTRSISWGEYQRRLPAKQRKEDKRIMKRLMSREGVRYVKSDAGLVATWLPLYLAVERRSWKASRGSAISSDPDRVRYFTEALEAGESRQRVEFHALFDGDEPIAVSVRFRAQRNLYDVMTCYAERYKQLYPGVVLELLSVKDVLDGSNEIVDSCAEKNLVVQRVWPHEIVLYRTIVFDRSIVGTLARQVHKGRRRIRFGRDPSEVWGSSAA